MKYIDQLNAWVEGDSLHDNDRNECCPDFSCCNKEVSTPTEIRLLFRDAYLRNNEELQMKLLHRFLASAISTLEAGNKIYIAGVEGSA